jgi:hypothetical protein
MGSKQFVFQKYKSISCTINITNNAVNEVFYTLRFICLNEIKYLSFSSRLAYVN